MSAHGIGAREILLVDDSDDDVELIRMACARIGLGQCLRRVSNGRQCMAYLRGEGEYAGTLRPSLILLDMNMPVMSGRDTMARIAADPGLRHIPVVAISSSSEPAEVADMYDLRCSSYVVKPLKFPDLVRAVQSASAFWLSTALLPGQPGRVS